MDYIKLIQNPLNLDSTFRFRCKQCGNCCRQREDIILTPFDLTRIARHLSVKEMDVIDRYCLFYIGQDSRLPVVLLKAIGPDKHCPFLQKNRCSIHAKKPTVCALFPLGRFADVSNGNGKTQYFLQPVDCSGKNETHTVREWLSEFDLLESEAWFQVWQETITTLSPLMKKLETKTPEDFMSKIYSILFNAMYLAYQPEQNFLPQFTENMKKLTAVLTELETMRQENKKELL